MKTDPVRIPPPFGNLAKPETDARVDNTVGNKVGNKIDSGVDSRVDHKVDNKVDHRVNHDEEISARAYELYVARGREEGHDLEDWLQAEMEITAMKSRSAAA